MLIIICFCFCHFPLAITSLSHSSDFLLRFTSLYHNCELACHNFDIFLRIARLYLTLLTFSQNSEFVIFLTFLIYLNSDFFIWIVKYQLTIWKKLELWDNCLFNCNSIKKWSLPLSVLITISSSSLWSYSSSPQRSVYWKCVCRCQRGLWKSLCK